MEFHLVCRGVRAKDRFSCGPLVMAEDTRTPATATATPTAFSRFPLVRLPRAVVSPGTSKSVRRRLPQHTARVLLDKTKALLLSTWTANYDPTTFVQWNTQVSYLISVVYFTLMGMLRGVTTSCLLFFHRNVRFCSTCSRNLCLGPSSKS